MNVYILLNMALILNNITKESDITRCKVLFSTCDDHKECCNNNCIFDIFRFKYTCLNQEKALSKGKWNLTSLFI